MSKLPPESKFNDNAFDINASTSSKSKYKNSKKKCAVDVAVVKSKGRKPKNVLKKDSDDDDVIFVPKRKKSGNLKISDELRKLIIVSLEAGTCSRKTAATTFNLPYATIRKIYKQFLDTGDMVSNNSRARAHQLQNDHVKFLLETLEDNCTLTMKQLSELTKTKFGKRIPSGIISGNIPSFHYSIKRIQEMPVGGLTAEIINDHKEYCELFLQLKETGRLLIHFDETDFEITMRRLPEREPLGQQILGVPPPSTRIRNKTIMASITENELLYYKAFKKTKSSDRIMEYLKVLFDMLSARNITGAVLIMGNTAFAFCQEIAEATQMAGHEVIFLPVCCPFLNPVENMFSQWIQFIRAKKPNSELQLEDLVESFDDIISVDQCQYYCKRTIDNARSCVNRKLIYAK